MLRRDFLCIPTVGFVQRKHSQWPTTPPITMAAAAGHDGSLAPHRMPIILIRHIGSMGHNPPIKRIQFSLATRGSMALKTLRWQGKFIAIIALPSERFEGHKPSLAVEKHNRLLGGLSSIDPMRWIGMTGLLSGARETCPATAAAIVVMVVLVESILNPPYVEG